MERDRPCLFRLILLLWPWSLLLLLRGAVHAFSPLHSKVHTKKYVTSYTQSMNRSKRIDDKVRLHVQVPSERENRGLLQILNDEVSEILLEKLNEKLGGGQPSFQTEDNKSKRKNYQTPTDGLSKFHRSILSTTSRRQRCVTGRYPLKITVKENPTRKWLSSGYSSKPVATSQMLVNGTSVERSLASYDRFQWLEDDERAVLHEGHTLFSLELLAEIHLKRPGYVNIMPAYNAGFEAKRDRDKVVTLWTNEYRESNRGVNGQNGSTHSGASKQDILERILEAEKERMWITGFSLTKSSGEVHFVEIESGIMGKMNKQTVSAIRWPNEVNSVPIQPYGEKSKSLGDGNLLLEEDALLISDGFLVPGRDNGGIYVVSKPGHERNEWRICLAGGNGMDGILSRLETKKNGQGNISGTSNDEEGWFYHRAIWIDLTGDGRQSVLTARAKRPSLLKKTTEKTNLSSNDLEQDSISKTQLVWLERPLPYRYDEATGTPLDKDGLLFDPFSPKHTPWKVRVLDEGPDVMFSVADMDTSDDTIEVFASQFFSRKVTLHSIQRGPEPRVVFRRVIDDRCGASFSSILANLDTTNHVSTRKVLDSGSTVPTLRQGDDFSHLLITSHECTFAEDSEAPISKEIQDAQDYKSELIFGNDHDDKSSTSSNGAIDGGSLFSYRVPSGKNAWKTEPWIRSVIATGFRVKGQLGNMINPGAPGFCYTFYPKKERPKMSKGALSRPLIGIAGDCAESAYILRPVESNEGQDPSSNYALMCEIECGATIGSIGIGYEDFCYAPQQRDYAKIYIPCYEKDKVLVFALGNGEDDEANDGW